MTKLTLSLNALAFGLSQLIYGPLSDRYGRRPVMLWGMAGFIFESVSNSGPNNLNLDIRKNTHTFLWWILDDPKISDRARELIGDSRNTLYWSAASSWEVSIKYALGRLPLPETPD